MRNRVITVPKDNMAERALDINAVEKEQLIELFIDDEDFNFLYQKGIFDIINREGQANIDDYEDDSVIGKGNLDKVLKALKEIDSFYQSQLLKALINLFREAFERNTGVYFFF